MLTLGVIGDTHIPDRIKHLHPDVMPTFKQANVKAILHTGDFSAPKIIRQLKTVAPVIAVRGNRDWFRHDDLPMTRVLDFEGVKIGLTHGHGGWPLYLIDKLKYLFYGPRMFEYFKGLAIDLLPSDVDIVVFGHTHAPLNKYEGGKLLFNPGSPCCPLPEHLPPSVGLLRFDKNRVEGEIVHMGKK